MQKVSKQDAATTLHVLSYVNDAVDLFEEAKKAGHTKLGIDEWKFLLLVDQELRMLQSKLERSVADPG